MIPTSRIYVAGHRGLVGSALLRRLRAAGCANLITRTHAELDLERQADVEAFFAGERPEYVFLAAAKVGGIRANDTYPADFIRINLKIESNVIEAAWRNDVKGLLFLGSSCIYPKFAGQPLKEEYLLTGLLEPTNEPYAVAKIAGIELCEAFNRQYGTRFCSVMPTNLYGPNDNYDLLTSHVLPALIRKYHLGRLAARGDWDAIARDEAKYGAIPVDFFSTLVSIARFGNKPVPPVPHMPPPRNSIRLWGTGTPRREFLHSDDLADACILLMNRIETLFSNPGEVTEGSRAARHLFNIGSGHDQSIADLAAMVASVVGYDGETEWDASEPDGTPQKLLDISRLTNMGWYPKMGLSEGVRSAYEAYCS
ncbi:GDP-L-fucose synthase family protein [Syntrophobacter fumaroxidans]|uniref:GDP-L-fucose synthase n=1 Tax=Syntrophobacter fumaroxidans (strain DSM 10017 / MPOB) TaxID=335543 RepID=A0LNN2_SYNFM|nr:GDP-L-fucose synthase [Syntrophobacter fumaroxidans]ABK19034.1 NAD-dependent epimerase/dehydratase [Syntrophobacter fumaroxidans MPOB]